MKIILIQPAYPHSNGQKYQTYLPGSLMNVGSRLLKAGLDVSFVDLNISNVVNNPYGFAVFKAKVSENDIIGFTVLGPPYIPIVIQLINRLYAAGAINSEQKILIGGEGVARVNPADFKRWFAGLNAIQITNDHDIALACGIHPVSLVSAYETSMVPMLQRLSDGELLNYLTTELSLFLSQGCKFGCAFCSANKNRREQYRDEQAVRDEITFICAYLARIEHKELRIYLSNLDGFQTPAKLEESLRMVHEIATTYGITPVIRCLATSRCTFQAHREDQDLLGRLRGHGLTIVAFGADGADEATWRRQNKHHNSLSELQTVCGAMKDAGITVELLMVIGFQDDGPRALWRDLKYSILQALKGRIIRPYLAKSQTPSGRWEQDNPQVKAFQDDASLLSRLDYAMLGSAETHPKLWQRLMVNSVYLTIITMLTPFGKCPTSPLVPVPRGPGRWLATQFNRLMPFDR